MLLGTDTGQHLWDCPLPGAPCHSADFVTSRSQPTIGHPAKHYFYFIGCGEGGNIKHT